MLAKRVLKLAKRRKYLPANSVTHDLTVMLIFTIIKTPAFPDCCYATYFMVTDRNPV